MATATTSYWCYRCSRFVQIFNQDPITCPGCDGGFVEEIENPSHTARTVQAGSRRFGSHRFPAASMYTNTTPTTSTILRRSRRNGGDRSPFNPVIVLRGGAATTTSSAASPSSASGENSNVEHNGRGFELYYDDGGGSGLRPLPPSMSEFLLGSGFDRLIDQLSQMEIQNVGRYEQPPASKAAVEAMPTVEIDETHVCNELYCAVCKEQFELGTKVRNMPCNHLYHSNCILPWLQLRNSCPVCRHELPAAVGEEGSESGGGNLNSSEEVPVGLTIWRLPGGGFAVGRFSGGRRGGAGENREFPVVYTEMDGGFSGGGLPRRVSWGSRGSRGRERGGFFGRLLGNLFGCFGGSSSSRLDSRISRSSRSLLLFTASSRRRRGWAVEVDSGRRRW
ncbi:PREDICTED: probable E3 ubiquitin-protein ligase RHC2A [Theobroma cacao]|uniref:RING-type E3 ubiquitin transferase n=1 Tax=Theobroma cacao TaxID=3641 RepID=A0AB32ULF4_THECC|nr:PREDICTED: probable E3 ubiquitin-protein ligase RHC2A [Theobroma cacao]